jgi:N-acetyltransferase
MCNEEQGVKRVDEQVGASGKNTDNKTAGDFDLQPVLKGATLTLRPLRADNFDILYAAASDPLIWEQHPVPTRYEHAVFSEFFASGLASGGALLVLDNTTGAVIGSSRYYDWEPSKQEVAIGYTFLARSHWGGPANREMKKLMLDHAFRWAKLAWFHVGQNNVRSHKAMAKIGGGYSHNAPTVLNGVTHDYAHYKILRPAEFASV